MSIAKKISASLGALVGLAALIGITALYGIWQINSELQQITAKSLPATYLTGRLDSVMLDLRGTTLHHVATLDPKMRAAKESQAADLARQARELLQQYEKIITSAEERKLFEGVAAPLNHYVEVCKGVREFNEAGEKLEAMSLYDTEADATRKELKAALKALVDFNREQGAAYTSAATSAARRARWFVLSLLGFAILAGGSLAFWIARGINRALTESVDELCKSAAGVGAAAAQVSSSSQSLAHNASEQAATLQETSASSQEIGSMARSAAAQSESAVHMMEKTRHSVEEANQTLAHMTVSMNEITASSERISKIIRVIDEIAFQTNILALNAAVEAARAGESGMGFAVVADEVRNLAQRSAQAARDTAGLIEESIQKSSSGKKKLDQVAAAISGVTDSSGKVKTLVEQVNAGNSQQAQCMEQILKAVSELERVVQKNAESAEESAATSDELNAQARGMLAVADRLKTLVGGSAGPQ